MNIKIRLASVSAIAATALTPFLSFAQMTASSTAAITAGIAEITGVVLASIGALFTLYGGFLAIRWLAKWLKKVVK